MGHGSRPGVYSGEGVQEIKVEEIYRLFGWLLCLGQAPSGNGKDSCPGTGRSKSTREVHYFL